PKPMSACGGIPARLLGRDRVRFVVVNAVLFLLIPDVAIPSGEDEAPQKDEATDLRPADVLDESLDQGRGLLARLPLGALLVGEEFVVDLQQFVRVKLLDLPGHSLHGLFFRDDWHRRTSDISFFTDFASALGIVTAVQQRTNAESSEPNRSA